MRSVLRPLFSLYHYLWSFVSAIIFQFPSRHIRVIGVTGTKGKTTTVALLAHIFSSAGLPAQAGKQSAYLSSALMSDGISLTKNKTGNSMPGRFFIQQFLRTAVHAQSSYAFIEVTSQGTVQHRHRFIRWAGVVFLDIHPEHIESHGSFQKYLLAKRELFSYARAHSHGAVFYINKDDSHANDFISAAGNEKKILFSSASPEIKDVLCPALPGPFNTINIAAAYAIAREEGICHADIIAALNTFSGVPGRMEFITHEPFEVVVDYAHTPESLEAVYQYLRGRVLSRGGKLICVLGSAGGGRDVWKRTAMGKHAGDYCDEIVLTNEDPWDEDPEKIVAMVHEGIKSSEKYNAQQVRVVMDRKDAITAAIAMARERDVVVLTGKGSESWIHVAGGKKISWSERDVVKEILNK